MQTLGISESTPRSEGRLKSLFWPSIGSSADVEYLAVQGYWVCALVAFVSFLFLMAGRQPVVGVIVLLFYYLGGVGVREHDRFAATSVFLFYLVDALALGRALFSPGGLVLRTIITALLLSNMRATWVAAGWQSGSAEAIPLERLAETWRDRFANRWPAWLWPKLRVVFYILAVLLLLLTVVGLLAMTLGFGSP
jgi:hypothetical protein